MRVIVFFGLTMGIGFFLGAIYGRAADRKELLALAPLPFLFAAFPLVAARRYVRAIREGWAVTAIIESIGYSRSGSRDTLDSIDNGMARGSWRLPDGRSLSFEIDKPWAKGLEVGSKVDVLVVGTNSRGVFPIRPHS